MEAEIRLSDESVVPEMIEQSKLCQEYSKIVATCSTPFCGEDCNFYGLLKHMQSTDRNIRKGAYIAWADMYESVSDKLDDIFLKLVSLRKTIAKKLGFSSYVEVAYLENRHFYYNCEDVAKFREQVVDVVVPATTKLFEKQAKRIGVDKLHYYDEQLVFPEGNADPIGDMDYLVSSARDMYREMSKETGEFFDFMCDHQLFDLQTKPAKHMGGYCTFIETYKAPFIFSNFNGTSADVDVLTHEAGHAFQAYTASKLVPLSSQIWSTNEISEIHSMTMEHFAYPYMKKFFGENSEKYCYAHLSEALKTVPYLCLVDHFQHEVYSHDYNAKELRACWKRLEKIYMPWRDYDGNKFLEEGGFWMQKQHIFLYPFYYIDYALAQMGAFEYYTRSKVDPKKAWNDYYTLCKLGGSKSYFELLKLGNLSNPFEKGSVEKACAGVIAELDKNTL
jgi:M3 family oligoendopeptidase